MTPLQPRKILQRLRHASFGELLYRSRHALDNQLLSRRVKRGGIHLKTPAIEETAIDELVLPAIDYRKAKPAVARILAGEQYSLQASPEQVARFCQRHSHLWQGEVSSPQEELDIRAVWEPARLQHVATILLMLRGTSEQWQMENFARETLFSWLAENPLLQGPQYQSAMECALRIPVFFYALKKLTTLSPEQRQQVLDTLYGHGWWVARRLSLYSSLGNHTVSEAVGLIFAGAVFRDKSEGRRWLEKGRALLAQEINHQVLADGGPAEQSFSYHRFVLDLYWLAVSFMTRNQLGSCSHLLPRLQRGESFLESMQITEGAGPYVGDRDDGWAIAPHIIPERGKPLKRDGGHEDRTEQIMTFHAAGYTVIHGIHGDQLVFDHGPLGMAPLCNHGHADALSFMLSRRGQPLLVDPGTYRYNGVGAWRQYFKSTRAHNTVCIDDQDQAIQETGFIWSHPYTCRLEACSPVNEGCYIRACHDGYNRLHHPVKHTRSILWLKNGMYLIRDRFSGSGRHTYELNLHCHPEVALSFHEESWKIEHDGEAMFLRLMAEKPLECITGRKEPLLGWYSKQYGQKELCPVLNCRLSGTPAEVSFLMVISPEPVLQFDSLEEQFNAIEDKVVHTKYLG